VKNNSNRINKPLLISLLGLILSLVGEMVLAEEVSLS
jgi:hypothetical protein